MSRMMVRIVTAALLAGFAVPASAQQAAPVERRVDKLEKEMRAVQRKVFPGGDGTYFEPDIQSAPAPAPGPSSTSPITDVIARVDAIETSLAQLTSQVEGLGNRQRILQQEFEGYKAATDQKIAAMAQPASPKILDDVDDAPVEPRGTNGAGAAKPASANGERRAAVAAVEVPDSGDAAEDSYLYGYRLWEAKFYPEAQTQLKKTIASHAQHRRASYAANLLGRAYLDEGKPALAVRTFYENYKDRPDGERAPDSLMYMGVALTRMNRKPDACKAFGELDTVYGARMSATLRGEADKARARADCT